MSFCFFCYRNLYPYLTSKVKVQMKRYKAYLFGWISGRREKSMGRTEIVMWTEPSGNALPTKHSCANRLLVNWSVNQIKSQLINLSSNSECKGGPNQPSGGKKTVPILDKVTTCVQPPTPPCSNPISSSPTFLPHVRVCASKHPD